MKKKFINHLLFITLLFFIIGFNYSYAQIGPVVGISETKNSLPNEITMFLNTYFPNISTKSIELKPLQNIYDIELRNGYDIKFNSDGSWIKIEAPDNKGIEHRLIRELLPGAIYDSLIKKRVFNKIEELYYNPVHGYKIEIDDDDDLYYDLNGNESNRPKVFQDYD